MLYILSQKKLKVNEFLSVEVGISDKELIFYAYTERRNGRGGGVSIEHRADIFQHTI
jgi:hypothetical protein